MAGLTLPPAEPDQGGDWKRLLRLWRDKLNGALRLPHLPIEGSWQLLRGQEIATSITRVRHGLGAPATGWLILRAYNAGTAAAVVEYEAGASASELQMIASAAVTIDLLVWR